MKSNKELVDEQLAICIEVSNKALGFGFDVEMLRWSWDWWVEELAALRKAVKGELTTQPPDRPHRGDGVEAEI